MQSMTAETEVCIIGGDPVGLTLAFELARYGIRCRVIDKRSGPIDVAQSCVLWSRTQEVLGAMEIRDKWLPYSLQLEDMSMYAYGKRLGSLHYSEIQSPYPLPLMVGQDMTEHLLIDCLAEQGVRVDQRNRTYLPDTFRIQQVVTLSYSNSRTARNEHKTTTEKNHSSPL